MKTNTHQTPEPQEANGRGLPTPTCSAVVACRWGWENEGFSILLVTPDMQLAKNEARDYADHRGGKYGVGVFDANGKQVYHAPSLYGETEIHRNHRLDTFESVGGFIVCSFEQGEEPDIDRAKKRWEQGVRIEKLLSKHNADVDAQIPVSQDPESITD